MNNTHPPFACRISRKVLLFIRGCVYGFFLLMIILLLAGCESTHWSVQREITPGVSVGISGSGKEVREISIR